MDAAGISNRSAVGTDDSRDWDATGHDDTADEENTLKIFVATDCHLGYLEKDEVRRDDSFVAFEEICRLACEHKADFMLLGGDLFHENKPSRSTLVRTIEMLRRYCLSDEPVKFQVVSDQTVDFPTIFGHVNYEDPHFNVGLPVFTIHGNHDDPAGVDNLSAIDILSACNLVNYFGKTSLSGSGVGTISIRPVLIRKGETQVALYGLGNIRDERLNKMFQMPRGVQWLKPVDQAGLRADAWFNIFVLHQNRLKSNPKNAISEYLLPRFLDLVIWGHEHECLIDPQVVTGMGFQISQPGSSVATSLIAGEAEPKHVMLLEVRGREFLATKVPLKSVRPFLYAEVSLKDEPDLEAQDPAAVAAFLNDKVEELLNRSAPAAAGTAAAQSRGGGGGGRGRQEDGDGNGDGRERDRRHLPAHGEAPAMAAAAAAAAPSAPGGGGGGGGERTLPIVRIRVDYTGYTTINPQRFGQKWVGKVANPHEILLFTKAAKKRQTTKQQGGDGDPDGPEDEMLRPEELNQQNIEALIAESRLEMEVIPDQMLGRALHDFVSKEEKMAFHSLVKELLDDTRERLVAEWRAVGGGGGGEMMSSGDMEMEVLEGICRQMLRRQGEEEKARRAAAAAAAEGSASASGGTLQPSSSNTGIGMDDDDGSISRRRASGGGGHRGGQASGMSGSLLHRAATRGGGGGGGGEGASTKRRTFFGDPEGEESGEGGGGGGGGGRGGGYESTGTRHVGGSTRSGLDYGDDDVDDDEDEDMAMATERGSKRDGGQRGRGRGRGRGVGRGRGSSSASRHGGGRSMRQTTLNMMMSSQRAPTAAGASVDVRGRGRREKLGGEGGLSGAEEDDDPLVGDSEEEEVEEERGQSATKLGHGRKRQLSGSTAISGASSLGVGRRQGRALAMEEDEEGGRARKRTRGVGGPTSSSISRPPSYVEDDEDDEEEDDQRLSALAKSGRAGRGRGTGRYTAFRSNDDSGRQTSQLSKRWGSLRK
ncbi:hypothetical protein CBR_g48040 [Chara braunii]|uniref:Mre11 DNA-binding domain-containing protein n=1 Tax=Chara braunii TaxID=69332 RepID=A0A388M1Y8_CHABU|nr:hypothetical protein CBR_g48040 [Chara braunii]|eukprot:GBG88571.1 hypothetical protein CBR_g48040 [Chara braunii]